MATFHLLNFGCRASQADGAALKQQLLQAGLREASSVGESQVAVLNTCTVTAAADAEVRQMVRRIRRLNPRCRILVTGCYAQRAPEEIAELEGVAWVVGNSHKHAIAQILTEKAESGRQKAEDRTQESEGREPSRLWRVSGQSSVVESHAQLTTHNGLVTIANRQSVGRTDLRSTINNQRFPPPPTPHPESRTPEILVGEISPQFHFAPVFPDDRTRPTLKIQDGCNARCSFCVIPRVRGRSRSLAREMVIDQIRALVDAGYLEIVLSGINLGSYGKDFDPPANFLGLLEQILKDTGIARIRISSIEPMDVSPALIRLVARERRLAQHFHIPLQSGCDRILRLMLRRYWAAQYAERILAIREAIPDCGIGADVMVGFPGETDQDHTASARFIASLPFTYLHIFPYSERPGTPAAASPEQVNGRVSRQRGLEIRGIVAQKRRALLAAQVGREVSALTLDDTAEDARIALTSQYLKVALPNCQVPANRLLDVRVARADDNMLYGSPSELGARG
jgi:threonylcarbamoyladenosine tRNA methylthiotransferase MtaB